MRVAEKNCQSVLASIWTTRAKPTHFSELGRGAARALELQSEQRRIFREFGPHPGFSEGRRQSNQVVTNSAGVKHRPGQVSESVARQLVFR